METRYIDPATVGINGVDLTALATTQYASSLFDLSRVCAFTCFVDVTKGGGAAANGDCKLLLQRYSDSTGTTTLGPEVDLITAIDTTSSVSALVAFRPGIAALAINGTVGTKADAASPAVYGKLILEVTTALDVGTGTATVAVEIQRK